MRSSARHLLIAFTFLLPTGCAVHVVAPKNFETTVPTPVVAKVGLPFFFDGRFSASIGDRDITSLFQIDASLRSATATLPLSDGLYLIKASACWSISAFLPLGACSSSSSRFEVGLGPSSYLSVQDAGNGNEAFVLYLRPDCYGATLNVKALDPGPGTASFTGTFVAPTMRVRGLAMETDYSFSAAGCGRTDEAVFRLRIAPPADAGEVEPLLLVLPMTYVLNFPNYLEQIRIRLDHVNAIYRQSGIQKRFTIGEVKTYDDHSPSCPNVDVNDPCNVHHDPQFYAANSSTVFHIYALVGGHRIAADPWSRYVDLVIPPGNPNQDFYVLDGPGLLSSTNLAAGFAHEFAHLHYAGAPEFYDHGVIDKTGVEPLFVGTEGPNFYYSSAVPARYFRDPMLSVVPFRPGTPITASRFGPLSSAIINENTNFTIGVNDFYFYYRKYHPRSIALTVHDGAGSALPGVHVDYYCLTSWTTNDLDETVPRAQSVSDAAGRVSIDAPVPFESTACNVMGLKLTKPGYVPTLRTVSSVELEEAAFVAHVTDQYDITTKMPKDLEAATLDCNDPDRHVAVSSRTATTITLDWCAVPSASQYELLLRLEGTAGFTIDGTSFLTKTTHATVSHLRNNSRYHLYIAPRDQSCIDCVPVTEVIEAIVPTAP